MRRASFFRRSLIIAARRRKALASCAAYYLLEEFSQPNAGDAKLLRRFWFDRVGGIRLARVQTYDDRGLLVTDVSYYNEKTLGSSATASLPSRIEITRPQDQYKLNITYQDSGSVELNREYRSKSVCVGKQVGIAGSRSRRSEQERSLLINSR